MSRGVGSGGSVFVGTELVLRHGIKLMQYCGSLTQKVLVKNRHRKGTVRQLPYGYQVVNSPGDFRRTI